MTSRRTPRLADAEELAAAHQLALSRIYTLANDRPANAAGVTFPEPVDKKAGGGRLWDADAVAEWFAGRQQARLVEHTPPTRDPQDLLTAAQASRFLGYKNANQVTTFVREHPGYFPDPDVVETMPNSKKPESGRRLWRVQTLLDWMATRPGSGKRVGAKRSAPPLPSVPADGDPDELLGATQAAALLGYKSVNSFSSSLSQGNLPLLLETDEVTQGGRRRWTRRRILDQAAQRRSR
ncbi:hypothetical protein [Streptomyces sp. NPDC094468]|uniref:hypothetical protein n=1 Tax=Streptomyces sp. NPDC094468 TaxID=3366066 RepID=UPI00382CD3BB